MDNDYSNRGYLLPDGCKDLIDAINLTGAVSPANIHPSNIIKQANGLMILFRLHGLESESIQIIVEGRHLQVVRKLSGNLSSPEGFLEVPPGYDLAKARATYVKDTLRIFIPKC
jgi:hypothetical protein